MTVVSRPRPRAALVAAMLAAVVAVPSIARAEAPAKDARADALFKEGRSLLDQKDYDAACPKLAESQRIDPGAGTLLALALCHEGQGKTATAWRELGDAAALGREVGRTDLANAAEKRAAAMEPSLSKLVVRVPEGAAKDLRVQVDGAPFAREIWGTPQAVDPGSHRVEVSAAGKRSRSYVVRLAGKGSVEIVIDRLDAVAQKPKARPAPAPSLVLRTEPPAPGGEPSSRGGVQRAFGLGIAGVGVVGLGAAAYFGGRALSQSVEASRATGDAANAANASAKDSLNMTMVTVSAGVGALALGTILYVTAPSSSKKSGAATPARATARLVPQAGPRQVGLGVTGTF